MKIDGGKMLIKPKRNLSRSFQLVGMLDHVLKILFHGLSKDLNIIFNRLEKKFNNSFDQLITIPVYIRILLNHKQSLSMHGMKIVKMELHLFQHWEMELFILMLYHKYFHGTVNQYRHLFIEHFFFFKYIFLRSNQNHH